ncbi:hypothetical protein Hanom_Chr09g00766551 [Helianthus anomalus]
MTLAYHGCLLGYYCRLNPIQQEQLQVLQAPFSSVPSSKVVCRLLWAAQLQRAFQQRPPFLLLVLVHDHFHHHCHHQLHQGHLLHFHFPKNIYIKKKINK